jgi:PTH1 family peptidyl-tRNA hydrolase
LTSSTERFLIVGLGNPGRRYQLTRHNLGFLLLDRLAEKWSCSFKPDKSQADLAVTTWDGKPILLAKPQTYMNLSGQAVAALVGYYRIEPANILVVLDDHDLPVGRLRLRANGTAGGHKGLASILTHLGTSTLSRLRIGIRSEGTSGELADIVLAKFSKSEWPLIDKALETSIAAVTCFIEQGIDKTMNQYNHTGS